MIRISATNLEAVRRWKDDPDRELADLLAYLRREVPPTDAMRAGTALHKVLELAQEGETLERVEMDGFTFDFQLEGELALPVLREVKLEKVVNIRGIPVTLVGVVDAMEARRIYDHKLTGRIDAENYTDSLQWRAYLEWFEADLFTYNLFEKYEPAGEPGTFVIKSFAPIDFFRYPGMHLDVQDAVLEFVDFVRAYMPEMEKAA